VLEHAELMQLMLPLIRADFELVQTYQYSEGPPLACPIAAYGGMEDVNVGRAELLAWQEQTNGGFELRMFAGDHFFVKSSESQVISTLTRHLNSIRAVRQLVK
jgi:medium-chain acyl-[acyl-carrier-protein] hydrolase